MFDSNNKVFIGLIRPPAPASFKAADSGETMRPRRSRRLNCFHPDVLSFSTSACARFRMPGMPKPLSIRVNKRGELPVYKQLVEQFVVSISTGRLVPGDSLPAIRQLARQKNIHYNTV